MKKNVLVMAFAMMALSAMADDVPGMVVTKTDGSTLNVVISTTRSIKFADGAMIINGKDNRSQSISLDDISIVTFSDVPTAVNAVVGTENQMMIITDISGREVYRGDSQSSDIPSSLHGIYIITVNGQSHKIAIK